MKPSLTKENYLWLRKAGYSKEEIRAAAEISASTLYVRRADWHISTAETEAQAVSDYQPKASDIPVWVTDLHAKRKKPIEEEQSLPIQLGSTLEKKDVEDKPWTELINWVDAPDRIQTTPNVARSKKGLRFNKGAMDLMKTKCKFVRIGIFRNKLIFKPTDETSWRLCRDNRGTAGVIRGNAIIKFMDEIKFPEQVSVEWIPADGILVAQFK